MGELVKSNFTAGAGIVELTLNRPDARNALSFELVQELEAAVAAVASNAAARVLILRGEGKSFCAGMDLRGVLDDAKKMGLMLHGLARIELALRKLSIPVIAAVQGAAIGGGCGLVVAADFAITHAEAKLGYPEVGLGVCPAVVAPFLISKIGAGRARAMLLAGGLINGTEAVRIGLATHLAPTDQIDATARELATKLAGGGPKAMGATKRSLHELDELLNDTVLSKAAELSASLIAGREAQERLRARFAPAPK
ncbi:MAG: enoyl-CoA hydratase/isomerase family protein [Planctomycetes bacterium]|nr:enoyl-CoA hydratase/isomerase family protein [Planctomycetota bacterium]